MRLVKNLFAQVIRFGDLLPIEGKHLYGRNLVRAFEDKYGFVESPKTVAEFDLSKGVAFLHGYFDNRILIDKVEIYNNGIVVETKSTTDDCLAILKDITEWAKEKASITFVEATQLPQLYQSHVEIEMDIDLMSKLSAFQVVGAELNKMISLYNEVDRHYQLAAFSFHVDQANPGPMPFKFERRANQPFTSNLFFSSSPLKTGDHLRLLDVLERAFA